MRLETISVTHKIKVDLKEVLENLYQSVNGMTKIYGPYISDEIATLIEKIYKKIHANHIYQENKCSECGGAGECAGGSHSWTCYRCEGTGLKNNLDKK